TWRPLLDTSQNDLLDRVKADGAQPDRVVHRAGDDLLGRRLHQTQHLDELALAAIAHPGFEKVAKMLKAFRQIPALQRRRLVESVRLHLDQRQIVQRVVNEDALAVGSRVTGDLRPATQGSPPHRRSPSPGPPGTRRTSAAARYCRDSAPAPWERA